MTNRIKLDVDFLKLIKDNHVFYIKIIESGNYQGYNTFKQVHDEAIANTQFKVGYLNYLIGNKKESGIKEFYLDELVKEADRSIEANQREGIWPGNAKTLLEELIESIEITYKEFGGRI